jgi:hypothetical protein
MLTGVQQEQCLLGAGVDVVIVLELHHQKELIPVILMLIYKVSEILLQLLVDTLHLSVCLWVVNCSHRHCDTEQSVKLSGELRHKLWTLIRNDAAWKSMQFPDIV